MWRLPLAAASFGAGIFVLGDRLRRPWALGLVAMGATALVLAAWPRARARVAAPAPAPGGSIPASGPRARVLRAAFGDQGGRAGADGRGLAIRLAALAAALVALGGGWGAIRMEGDPDLSGIEGRPVGFLGTAASDVRNFDEGWGLEADLQSIGEGPAAGTAALRVWLRGRGEPPGAEAGEPLRGSGLIRGIRRDGSGFTDYLARRGVVATVTLADLEILGPATNPALRVANAARRTLARGAARVLPDREAGLLLGLTIGETSGMDPEIEEDFRATGLGHLVAVSGSNVAMVLAPALGLAALARARPAARFALGLLTIGFFALVTRWEPSVLRASVMASLALLGAFAGRPRDTGNLLGAAVLLLLVADPRIVHALAFQLSVAATAGIVVLAGPLADRWERLPRPLAVATAATVGAQAGVTPLLLANFGVVPAVALPANVLAFPAVAPAFLGGVVAAVTGLAWEPLGRALGKVAALPIAYLAGVADRMAHLPLPSLVGLHWLLPAGVVALALLMIRRSSRGRTRAALAWLVLAPVVVWVTVVRGGPPAGLSAIFFDVGQGDAALVRTPEGVNVLIDAGPDERLTATKLAALGIHRLDLVVASHAHADHVAGLPAVLARHPVGLVLEPGCPADSPPYERFLEAVEAEEVPVHRPRGGARIRLGGLLVEVLGPDECAPGSPNDDSIIIRLSYGGATLLLPGDAEIPAQRDLLDDGDPVGAEVLKVPHHGGATSDVAFFDRVAPQVAVVSVGENEYGHPVRDVLDALRAAGASVVRTDRAGDVVVRFDPGGLRVESR